MKYKLKTENYNNGNTELILYDLLKDRNIDKPEDWLFTRQEDEYSPFLLTNMKKAIEMLNKVLKKEDSNIIVVVDSDLDGYSSGAIIMSMLNQINYNSNIDYVLHPGKEHGIDLRDIPDDTDLIIVPDAGSSQKEEHLKLLEKGKQVIILDHHEIENDMDYGSYEENIVIVNSQIDYPNPALSGAGVALKFVKAYYNEHKIIFPNYLYSLAACGIIADVMDISYLENKRIVDLGLKYFMEHSLLREMIRKNHNNNPTIKDIGWIIGPNINAIIRLGTTEQKNTVFKALVSPNSIVKSTKRGEEDKDVYIYEEAIRLCENAKKRQSNTTNKNIGIVEKNIDNNKNFIMYIDENQDLSFELSGLIANKLLSKYNKPIILLREYNNKGIIEYRGSMRGKPAEGLDNLRELLKNISGVNFVEGHAFAAGIGIEKDNIIEFSAHLNDILKNYNFNSNLYLVDFIAKYNNINFDNALVLSRDDIWCHGVEKPLAVLTDLPSTKYEVMGDKQEHLKFNCGRYDIIMFYQPKLVEKLLSGNKYIIDVIGEFSIDKTYNVGRLQLIVKDFNLKEYKEETAWDIIF